MFDKNYIKADFGSAAASYDEKAQLQKIIRDETISIAETYFPDNSRILDIGCGTAAFYDEVKKLDNGWWVTGVDIAYGMCKKSAEKGAMVINADAEMLPFADSSFDGVFSSLVMQWVDNPKQFISEILRILKPEGMAVITSFVDGTISELEKAFAEIDSFPHISKFVPSELLLNTVAHLGGVVLEVNDENRYVESYDDVMSVLRSIKNIGAGNKLLNRRKGLMTPRQLEKLKNSYEIEDGKYPLSWNVMTMVFEK
ncbi:MAG: methyltransferase domain-containing protein [Rickettsiales bacterium]